MRSSIIFFLIEIFCLPFISVEAQTMNGNVQIRRVSAPSGLILREQPSRDSKRLAAIPKGEKVMVNGAWDSENYERIEGNGGYWLNAFYEGQKGYVFDAFLEEVPVYQMFRVDNHDGSEKGKIFGHPPFIGLFETQANDTFEIRPLTAQKKSDPNAHGISNEWYETDLKEEQPFLFFSGIYSKKREIRCFREIYPAPVENFLMPGMTKSFFNFNTNSEYLLFATGNIQEAKDQSKRTYPLLEGGNYRVIVERIFDSTKGLKERQVLFEFEILGTCDGVINGFVELFWTGDIDGDEKTDFILRNGCYGSDYYLFLSSEADEGYMVKLVCVYSHSCC